MGGGRRIEGVVAEHKDVGLETRGSIIVIIVVAVVVAFEALQEHGDGTPEEHGEEWPDDDEEEEKDDADE